MKIQVADQLKIYTGAVNPEDNTLKDLVAHLMLNEAHLINDVGFAVTSNPDAEAYVSKMEFAIGEIINFHPITLEKLLRYAVIALAEEFTFSIIQGLTTDADWVVKINTVKLRIVELLARVNLAEKQAYETL